MEYALRKEAVDERWTMKTAQEVTNLVRATNELAAFRPCAFFDSRLDCIRVIAKDCSVTETRVNPLLTVLEANYPDVAGRKCVGFTIKGARHFCKEHALDLSTPIKISDLLDAVLKAMPDVIVEAFVDHVARPLVREVKIEQVEPALLPDSSPQQA
jgi:hypothetical protein